MATPETASYVASHLGPDEIIVRDMGFEDAAWAAFVTARDSLLSWVIKAPDGEPVALFGADGDPGDDWGSAWLFSTHKVGKVRRMEFVKGLRTAIGFSRELWPELRIAAEDRSEKQTRFLELIGFRASPEDKRELVL